MANRRYPQGKINGLKGAYNLLTDPVMGVLVDLADYPLTDFATDEFLSDIPGAAIVGTAVQLTSPTLTLGPTGDLVKFSSASFTMLAVTGDTSEALLLYVSAAGGDYLLILDDTATGTPGLPVTPASVNITFACPANGWWNT